MSTVHADRVIKYLPSQGCCPAQSDDGGVVDGLVEFRTGDGAVVAVEAVEERSGSRLVSRGDGAARAAHTFEGALDGVRAAAEAALRVFRDGSLRPDGVEIEFA